MPGLSTPLRQLALVTRFGGIGCEVDLALNKAKTVKKLVLLEKSAKTL